MIAIVVLVIKYMSCGLILIWPVYLLLLLLVLSPVSSAYIWYTLFLIPGLIYWHSIYMKSVSKEYRRLIKDHVVNKGVFRELIFGE